MVSQAGSRKRLYSAPVTFWLMLGQVFSEGSLRSAVREVQASVSGTGVELPTVGGSTGSYSDARKRLEDSELEQVNRRVCAKMPARGGSAGRRRILVVDGTGTQLEDTLVNQSWFPQPSEQKTGCGFPVVQLLGLMNLNNGALEHFCHSPLTANEGRLFECELASKLRYGDVLLADRGFCSFLQFAQLSQRGVHSLMRLNHARLWPKGGQNDDVVVAWKRPPLNQCPEDVTEEQWEQLPPSIAVRYVRRVLRRKGFRDQVISVATTLMHEPADEILMAYARRWEIELTFDDLKTTMGMNFIKAKSPEIALKMIHVHLIAYNLVRLLMFRAAMDWGGSPRRISFKGALDAIRAFSTQMQRCSKTILRKIGDQLIEVIARDRLPYRPFRIEPRVRKRRPKPFPFMTRTRQILKTEIIQKTTQESYDDHS